MDLQNRENFLNKLAAKMGKARAIIPEPMDVPVNTYPTERLTHLRRRSSSVSHPVPGSRM